MRYVVAEKLHVLRKHEERQSGLRSNLKPVIVPGNGVVSIVFLTWERDSHIRDTIESFLSFSQKIEPKIRLELISIDNGSRNKNVRKILSKYKWDIAIRNTNNVGISAALNQAYSASTGEFIMCLEDDWMTVATKPIFTPSIRILREFKGIAGIRLRESIQNCIEFKKDLDVDRVQISFDKNKMEATDIPWKGKYGRRRWFDERKTSAGDIFYTWANPKENIPSVYCNPCFLFRKNIFTQMGPIRNEMKYSMIMGRYYDTAILVDEKKFIHMGEKRHPSRSWRE